MGRNEHDGNTGLAFGIGLLAGAVIGVAAGFVLATEEGRDVRRKVGDKARTLRHEANARYRRAGSAAGEWAERGRDVAERLRTAAAEGLREARKHSAAPRDPRGSDLAGVEGTVDL